MTSLFAKAFRLDRIAWLDQTSSPGPSFPAILLAICGPLLLEQLIKIAMVVLALPAVGNQMPWWGRLAWLSALLAGNALILCRLMRHYPLTVRANELSTRNQLLSWSMVVVPILIYYLLPTIRFARKLEPLFPQATTTERRTELAAFLHEMHTGLWAEVGFGTDGIGVLFGSLLVLMMPLAEEILFRGYLMNAFGRRWGNPYVAVVATAGIFAALHVFRTARGCYESFCNGLMVGKLRRNRWGCGVGGES